MINTDYADDMKKDCTDTTDFHINQWYHKRISVISDKAFSLVEIMVVVLISTVAFAGIYSTFAVGNKAWIHYNDVVVVKKEARRALFAMVNELREAENVRVIQSESGSALHFFRPKIGAVSYIWSTQGDNAYKIIRRSQRGVRIMAQHISVLTFENLQSMIAINITAGKQTTVGDFTQVVLREKVALRSKIPLFQ